MIRFQSPDALRPAGGIDLVGGTFGADFLGVRPPKDAARNVPARGRQKAANFCGFQPPGNTPSQGRFALQAADRPDLSQQEACVTAYITRLKEAVEQDAEELEHRKARQADDARERLTPLQERLARLLATIPEEVQREGLSLTTVQASLRGRWRGSAHPGEVGAALRAAGFVRRRQWSDENGFRSLWFLRNNRAA